MKKIAGLIILSTLLLWIPASCGSAKKAEKSIAKGDYDSAFELAVQKLTEDKYKKSNQDLIPSLKTAYDKSRERDIKLIKQLKKQNNSLENLKKIYKLYSNLDIRQDDIKSLLPLQYEGKEVSFTFDDYEDEIKQSKNAYSALLYSTATKLMKGSKTDARQAHKLLEQLEYVNPGYRNDVSELIEQAKIKGSTLVYTKVVNRISQNTTDEQIQELTRISSVDLNDPWVIYHHSPQSGIDYDYEITYLLEQLTMSPEQLNSETVQQEKQIKDGWEYVYDENGNVMKDENGNDIKKDKIITVKATVKLFQQLKTAQISGKFSIKNLHTQSLANEQAITSEAKFENVFGVYQGDPRAIDQKYHQALQNKEQPFPPDEEFVKYALADFRIKCLNILNAQNFD